MVQTICSKCGGELVQNGDGTFKCKFCGAVYKEDTVKKEIAALSQILDDEKREKVAAFKQALWKKVNEEYNDSAEIVRLCREIKKLTPDDFYANFYEAANSERESDFIAALKGMDVIEHYSDMGDIIDYALRSVTAVNMDAICDLIERAYKQTDLSLYNEYRTKFDAEAVKVNDCVFDPAYPRNVFVCYSSKDMDSVETLVRYLEEQGLLCFVAIRNLQHGRGAVQNYWQAIQTAIENCECVVFLSSTNSRSIGCDALRELRYVCELEQRRGVKIKKIEYLLENYTGAPVERTFRKIFDGLEYCYDKETVFDRIMAAEPAAAPAEEPVLDEHKHVKYCAECGYENSDSVKFCSECGNDVFVSTREEYIELLRRAKKELEQRREEQAKAEAELAAAREQAAKQREEQELEERRQREESERRAREEADRAKEREREEKLSREEEDDYFSGRMKFVDINVLNPGENDYRYETDSRHTEDYIPSSAEELIRGQHIVLPEGIKNLTVSVSNVYKVEDVSADLYVFLLDGNDRVLSESDLVFFGNTSSLNESVTMDCGEGEEKVYINFPKVNQDIERIRFILSFGKEEGRVLNFSMLDNSEVTIEYDDMRYYFRISDVGRVESVCVLEFYRIRNKWKLRIQATGLQDDIDELCNYCGIEVEE